MFFNREKNALNKEKDLIIDKLRTELKEKDLIIEQLEEEIKLNPPKKYFSSNGYPITKEKLQEYNRTAYLKRKNKTQSNEKAFGSVILKEPCFQGLGGDYKK